MFEDFKKFVMRGNVIDMAVGVIIGAAFGKIVASLVEDVMMPPLGLLMGRADFSGLFVSLGPEVYPTLAAAKAAGAPTLNYGLFINTVINFLIVSMAVYALIRGVNRLKHERPKEAAAPRTRECPLCLSQIPIAAKRCAHCTADL